MFENNDDNEEMHAFPAFALMKMKIKWGIYFLLIVIEESIILRIKKRIYAYLLLGNRDRRR